MKVETFVNEEVTKEHPEVSMEAQEIIKDLCLTGQESLLHQIEDGGTKVRIPYRIMTADEMFTYSVLCPDKMDALAYSGEAIPFRVLEVLSHATKTGHFDKGFEVWSRTSAMIQDPVLVGKRTPPGSKWGEESFLLARWGEELDTFVDLLAKAKADWKNQLLVQLASLKRKIESDIDNVKRDGFKVEDSPSLPAYSAYSIG